MKRAVYILAILLLNLSKTFAANADIVSQTKAIVNSENTIGNGTGLTDDIKRKSFEFGLGGAQLQARGSYRPNILNNKLDVFLKTGFGFIAAAKSYFWVDSGFSVELGTKYFFNNSGFFKVLAGYTFPGTSSRAFFAGIGIGTDLMVNEKLGFNLGLDFGSTFESGGSGSVGGIMFLRPEINVKNVF